MLRFRPIAPKPTTGEAVVSSSVVKITGKRPKRKYVKVRARKNTKTRGNPPQKSSTDGNSLPEEMEAMLQQSQEKFDSDKSCGNGGDTAAQGTAAGSVIQTWITVESVTDNIAAESAVGLGFSDWEKINSLSADTCHGFVSGGMNNVKVRNPPQKSRTDGNFSPEEMEVMLQLSLERSDSNKMNLTTTEEWCDDGNTAVEGSAAGSVIQTWITVESVTDNFAADCGVGLGLSDWEKINRLSADTCPGFVSDGGNNVIWINEAYRRMVGEEENGIMVRLAVKGEFPDFTPSFACRARLSQRTKEGQIWNRIVACDVWRMEVAGFAWKLDVKTAIGLGI